MKNIAIFTSSSETISTEYKNITTDIAKELSSLDLNLIFGAGSIGLMKIFAEEFHKQNRHITGVITKNLHELGVGAPKLIDDYIITNDLYERKKIMIEKSDIFLIFPGGIGTLDEFFDVLATKQLNFHNKEIILFNYKNIFDKLIELLESLYNLNFINNLSLYKTINNSNELIKYIKNLL